MTSDMIAVRSLRKRFGIITALDGISFSVGGGEVVGFLGPNGAGKTTAMKIATGLLSPTSGSVEICGHSVRDEPFRAKQHIGYLPEGAPLYGDMTPATLLKFVAAIRHLPPETRNRRIGEIIDVLELGPVLPRRIDSLSKGYKRRVGLAQAILHDPDVLILDEPTDGLDPNQKRHVRDLIRTISPNKAIVISTHLLEEVEAVCDRALIINQGRIVMEGSPAELTAKSDDAGTVFVRVGTSQVSQARSALDAIPGIAITEIDEPPSETALLQARAETGPVSMADISTALARNGVEIIDLRLETGSLDEVFHRVTRTQTSRQVQPS